MLTVLAWHRHELTLPIAVYNPLDAHAAVLECSPAARDQGVAAGMSLARALGCCPELQLIDYDEARVTTADERFLTRVEALGAQVDPIRPGRVLFDVSPLLRLYGGLEGVLARLHEAFPHTPTIRIGMGPNRFVAEVAAWRAAPGGVRVVAESQVHELLQPLPIAVLGLSPDLQRVWSALGLQTLAEVTRIDEDQMADRFGAPGLEAWRRAHGQDDRTLRPRLQQDHIEVGLTFPEATGNLVTLTRAVQMLVERVLAHPSLAEQVPRTVRVTAHLVSGGSWCSRRVLRRPTRSAERITLTACVELETIPAPVERIEVRFQQLVPHAPEQRTLDAQTRERRERLHAGVSHVQAALGEAAMLSVLEVAPESRVPERRAVLVATDPKRVGHREAMT